ncbi:MAG: hypothetical protein V4710_24845, partial [Verrucomicrobiota bacterium]
MISLRLPILVALLHLGLVQANAAELSIAAGTGEKGFSGDKAPAARAQIAGPNGVVAGPNGALYLCDTENQRIRKVAPDGTITT